MAYTLLGRDVLEKWIEGASSAELAEMETFIVALLNGPELLASGSFVRSNGQHLHYSHLRSLNVVVSYWYAVAPMRVVRLVRILTIIDGG